MKKRLAKLLRAIAAKLDKDTKGVLVKHPLTFFGRNCEPALVRSNYALDTSTFKSKRLNMAEFKRYCAQDLKDVVAESLHISEEGGAYVADLIILIPVSNGK